MIGSPPHLLRARVVRRQAGKPGLGSGRIGVEQLGDTEVQQLRVAGGRDKNVARLEVAMHHQIAMSVFDRFTDLEEQAQAAGTVEFCCVFV